MTMKVAIVGSGYMGRGIGHTLARGGASVTLVDRDSAGAEAALEAMLADVAGGEAQGLLPAGATEAVRSRSFWSAGIEDGVKDAGLVVEAVFEDIDVKHEVIHAIERSAPIGAVIATNTSVIPVTSLASVMEHPERFCGIHWFNPAAYLPSVEVILGEKTDEALLGEALALLRASGKAPVVVADTPGFVCNRLQFALFKEAATMVEEGVATPEKIDAVVRSSFGYRLPFFGPFAIADMAGLDVYANSYKTLSAAYGTRFAVPPSLRDKVARGDLGTKSGHGYLDLSPEDIGQMIDMRDRSYVALLELRDRLESESHSI